jgi:hypothetical protein
MLFSAHDDRDWLDLCQVQQPSSQVPPTLQFDNAAQFLALLDADTDKFVFGAHDDDKERVRALVAAAKAGGTMRPNTFQSRFGSLDDDGLRR